MIELFELHPWFEAMLLTISQEILKVAAWGLIWRVTTGAGLSILDMASDINVVLLYLRTDGQHAYGYLLMAMIVLSVWLQLLLVFVQFDRLDKSKLENRVRFAKEILITLTGFKPAIDAHRVSSSAQQEKFMVCDCKAELGLTKACEMFAESIPGCLLQSYAYLQLLKQGKNSTEALASIFISAFTAGFTCASIAYDADTDPEKRRDVPAFYGYIPDAPAARTVMFFCLMFNSALMLVIRCFSGALVLMLDKPYFLLYMIADMSLFFALLLARGDVIHHLPIHGILCVPTSVLLRFMTKIIGDWTGIVHLRHPSELGGMYFTLSLIIALGSSFAGIFIYYEEVTEVGEQAISRVEAFNFLFLLVGAWTVTSATFLAKMKREYRNSFWSTKTTNAYIQEYFTKGKDDATKANIFKKNKNKWAPIRKDVKAWVVRSYFKWELEQPHWYTCAVKARIPRDMCPGELDRRSTY